MTGGDDPGAEGWPDERALQSGRAWQHPSEVGLATRGRADKRRATLIASGVVLGGVGLLLSGLVMAGADEPVSATTSTVPAQRAQQSVALVMSIDDDHMSSTVGVVLDDDGHVLVDAAVLEPGARLVAKCGDGASQPVTLTSTDPTTDLAVVQLEHPAGVPVSVADRAPRPGAPLTVVHAGGQPGRAVSFPASRTIERGPQLIRLIGSTDAVAAEHFDVAVRDAAGADLEGGLVFDRSGRLAGMVQDPRRAGAGATVRVLSASDAVEVAESLLGLQR